nr:MAG TPA: Flagellar and Swarming motility protein [Caudoviricetes sp.]
MFLFKRRYTNGQMKESGEVEQSAPLKVKVTQDFKLIKLTDTNDKVVFVNAAKIVAIHSNMHSVTDFGTRIDLDTNNTYEVFVEESAEEVVKLIEESSSGGFVEMGVWEDTDTDTTEA